MCDVDYNVTVYAKVIGIGTRAPRNVYILEEIQGERWYLGQTTDCCIVLKRLEHLNFDNIVKVNKQRLLEEFQGYQNMQTTYESHVNMGIKQGLSSNQKSIILLQIH